MCYCTYLFSVGVVVRSWRDPLDRDEPRGGARSHRAGDAVQYDRGDYSTRRKRFDRGYDDDDDEDGT